MWSKNKGGTEIYILIDKSLLVKLGIATLKIRGYLKIRENNHFKIREGNFRIRKSDFKCVTRQFDSN